MQNTLKTKTAPAKAPTKAAAKKAANKPAAAKKAANKPAAAPVKLTFAGGGTGTYRGSPTFRGHGKKLSPVSLSKPAASVTDRDQSFVTDLRKLYGAKPFPRLDCDAGNLGRAITLGLVKYVAGGDTRDGHIYGRDAQFQLTK
jgi:hypothetical protein